MPSKVSSKRLASKAAKLLQMSDEELEMYLGFSLTLKEFRSYLGCVVAQAEPEKPKKAKVRK